MLDEHKTETWSKNHKLKEEIVGLRCEVAELKKIEEPAQASQFQLRLQTNRSAFIIISAIVLVLLQVHIIQL